MEESEKAVANTSTKIQYKRIAGIKEKIRYLMNRKILPPFIQIDIITNSFIKSNNNQKLYCFFYEI